MTTPDPSIFRAYDIRGVVGKTLTVETVDAIGRAIGSVALSHGEKKIIVARDGRLSGPTLMEALTKGLLNTGCDVIDIGAVPTPLLYFATHVLLPSSGVMLTGSHNPPEYNGLKVVIAGETLSEKRIKNLYQRILKKDFCKGKGKLEKSNVLSTYQQRVCKDVQLQRPLKVVVDCGNGIAGSIAPTLLRELGCKVVELFCNVDGHFPNHHPDPSCVENLKELIHAVGKHHADLGIAFDGDADRLGVVTNQGKIIWPDRLLMYFAENILKKNPEAGVVFDVKCTAQLPKLIKRYGGKPLMWKSGHSLIKAKMREAAALLAGEMSGHIYFADRWFGFDDALYAAARLLESVSTETKSIDEIFASLPDSVNTPELQIAIAEDQKFKFVKQLKENAKFENAEINTIDGLRVEFENGWGLLRASNTTPKLILRFEADSQEALQRIQEIFREQIKKINPTLEISF